MENNRKYKNILLTYVVLVVGVVFGWYAVRDAYKTETDRNTALFERSASLLISEIHHELDEAALNGVKLVAVTDDFSKLDAKQYQDFITANNTMNITHSILFKIRPVKGATLLDEIAKQKALNGKELVFKHRYQGDTIPFTPIANKIYYPIENEIFLGMTVPPQIGFDFGSLPGFRKSIEKASMGGAAIAMPLTTQVGRTTFPVPVLIMLVPINSQKKNEIGRVPVLAKMLYVNEILNQLSQSHKFVGLEFRINGHQFNFNQDGILRYVGIGNADESDVDQERLSYSQKINIVFRDMSVVVTAKAGAFETSYGSAYFLGGMVLAFFALIIFIIINQFIRTQRVERLVAQRTMALRKAHGELEEHFRKLQQLNSELMDTRAEAEKSNRAKSDFLTTMSHELRTPLNSVLGFSEILIQQSLGPIAEKRYVDYARNIHESGSDLLDLVNDIIDLAKLESGKVEISLTPTNVQDFFENALSSLMPQAKTKSLNLTFELSKSMPDMILMDAKRMKQILLNLAGNALKFTREGGVRVIVKEVERLHDAFDTSDTSDTSDPSSTPGGLGNTQPTYWMMEVIDTGIGIEKTKISLLFDRFSQLDPGITREYGGTGLGLAICKELSHLMGGSVQVESVKGVGSTFRVIIPLYSIEGYAVDDADSDFI